MYLKADGLSKSGWELRPASHFLQMSCPETLPQPYLVLSLLPCQIFKGHLCWISSEPPVPAYQGAVHPTLNVVEANVPLLSSTHPSLPSSLFHNQRLRRTYTFSHLVTFIGTTMNLALC